MRTLKLFIVAIIAIVAFLFVFRSVGKNIQKQTGTTEKIVVDTTPFTKTIEKFAPFILHEMDSCHTVGAAYTIVYNGEIRFTKTYGVKKVGTTDSVNIHTIFRLASVSKGFAGVLACLLEEDSILSLNDRIIDYLPTFRLKDSVNTAELRIKHILSHTSGLVPHSYDNLAEEGVPYSEIISELNTVDISGRPGEIYSYQNIIFSLIDTILTVKTGHRYSDLLEKKIFRPLKMRNASASPDVFFSHWKNVAYPHVKIDSGYASIEPNLGYYNVIPAAGVNASISDMGRWLQALMGFKPEILDSMLLTKIETPFITTPLKRSYTEFWDPLDKREYSYGWRIFTYKGRKIMYHGGYVKGYRAEIAFCPEENIGIAYLENSPDVVSSMFVPVFFGFKPKPTVPGRR